jgi:ceramide glucosyltransferase
MVVTGLLAAWALAYMAMVAVVATRRPAAVRPRARARRRVLVVRPCTGDDATVTRAMATMPTAVADLEVTWVGCVADAEDAAWPLVQRCATALRARGVDAHALLTGATGPNRKAEQVAHAHAMHGGGHDALVIIDADVDMATVDLDALLAALGGTLDDGRIVGATWCPPAEPRATTWADRLSQAVLNGSWHAFSVLARLDPRVVVGKTLAIDAEAIARIGDLHELRHYLGEDFELGRRIEAAGLVVHAVPRPVASLVAGRSLAQVVERYTRWLWVVRAQRPWRLLGYPLLIAAAPLLLVGAALVAPLAPMTAVGVAVSTFAARLAVTMVSGSGRVGAPIALAADVLLLVALLRACTRRSVRWAEHTLRLGGDGRLQPSTEQRNRDARERGEQARREVVASTFAREQR